MSESGSTRRPKRRHPAHGILFVDGRPTIIFDTVCTRARKPWLANDHVHRLLTTVWQEAAAWLMGRYVIMPDHIHFFAAAADPEIDFENWIKYWKSLFSKRHGNPGHRWLTDHWDTRMRSERQYEEEWHYILGNPVRHDFVACVDDWPYKGEVYPLRWS